MSFVEEEDVLALGEEVAVALWKLIGVDVPTPMPRLTYAEAMARYGTDKPDTRFGHELVECTEFFKDTGSGSSSSPTSARSSCPAAPRSRASSSTAGRSGRSSAAHRDSPTCWSRRTACSAARVAKYLTETEARRAGGARRREAGRLHLLRGGGGQGVPGPARRRAPGDRAPLRAHRARHVGVPLGQRRAAVRAGQRGGRRRRRRGGLGRVDRGAPRVHVAEAGVPRHASTATRARRSPTPTTWSATATRSAAGRSVSTAATSRSASSRSWGSARRTRRRSSGSSSTRSSTARRRTAGSRSAGTGSAPCCPAPTRSGRSSRSRSPAAGTTR